MKKFIGLMLAGLLVQGCASMTTDEDLAKLEKELMAVELCLKYARHGQFILPPSRTQD